MFHDVSPFDFLAMKSADIRFRFTIIFALPHDVCIDSMYQIALSHIARSHHTFAMDGRIPQLLIINI